MLVEFALVVVLLFFVLYGIIAFGMAISLRQSMGQAAGEAVRAGIVSTAATNADREVEAEAFAEASTNGLGRAGFGDADATIATCASFAPTATPIPAGDCLQVVFTYDYSGAGAIVPDGPFGVILPDVLTASAVGQIVP